MKFIGFFLFLFTLVPLAHGQDVVIGSELSGTRLQNFYQLLRSTWVQETGSDPLQYDFEELVEFDLSTLINELNPEQRQFISDLQRVLNLDLLGGKFFIRVHKARLKLQDQNSEIFFTQPQLNDLLFKGSHKLKGLQLEADFISIICRLPRYQGMSDLEISFDIDNPKIELQEQAVSTIQTNWSTSFVNENFKVELTKVGMTQLLDELLEKPELLIMSITGMNVPLLRIQVGNRHINFDPKKIEQFILKRLNDFKILILELVQEKYREKLENILDGELPFFSLARKHFWAGDEIGLATELVQFSSPREQFLEIGLNLDFCMNSNEFEKCFSEKAESVFDANRTEIEFSQNQQKYQSDIHLQIKQKLINKFLSATIKADMWQELLDEESLSWAEFGAFFFTNKKGKTFDLYLDFYHHLTKTEGILVGQKSFRFPIKLNVELAIREVAGKLQFQLKVLKVYNDEKSLLKGYPEIGLLSEVGQVPRFKKKLLTRLKNKLTKFDNRTLIDFTLPDASSTLIDQVIFESDSYGTVHGFFDLR